jgi:hypothetical protein
MENPYEVDKGRYLPIGVLNHFLVNAKRLSGGFEMGCVAEGHVIPIGLLISYLWMWASRRRAWPAGFERG